MTDTRRAFNGTIPEPRTMSHDVTSRELSDALKSEQIAHYKTADKLIKAEQELRRQQRIKMYEQRVSDAQRDHIAAQKRIAELEAQLASAYRDKMHLEDTCNFQHEMLLSCQRERDALEKELLEERASYEAENQRLKETVEILKQALEHTKKDKAVF